MDARALILCETATGTLRYRSASSIIVRAVDERRTLLQVFAASDRSDLPSKVGFIFELPESINVPAGSTYFTSLGQPVDGLMHLTLFRSGNLAPETEDHDGRPFVTLRFHQVVYDMPSPISPAVEVVTDAVLSRPSSAAHTEPTQPIPRPKAYATVVEAATVLLGDAKDSLSDAFDRCLEVLERYLRAYRVAFSDPLLPVVRQRLPPMLVFFSGSLRDPTDWNAKGILMLHLHFQAPAAPDSRGEADFDRFQAMLDRQVKGDPIGVYVEAWLRADRALEREGDYGVAVILAYVAAEVLLDTVLTLLLWEDGWTPEDAATEIYTDRTAKRVRSQFKHRLGGTWETEGSGPVAEWVRRLGRLRHRVVHMGYAPTYVEALDARGALHDLDVHVKDCLITKRRTYPRSVWLLLGEPGLKKRNKWSNRMARLYESIRDEPNWVESYIDWRRRFDAARPE